MGDYRSGGGGRSYGGGGGGGGGFGGGGGRGGGGYDRGGGEEMIVPGQAVGAIIGKGGENIRNISDQSGARINFKNDEDRNAPERTAIIQGNPDAVDYAKQLIQDTVDRVMNQEGGGGGGRGYGGGRGGGGGYGGGGGGYGGGGGGGRY